LIVLGGGSGTETLAPGHENQSSEEEQNICGFSRI